MFRLARACSRARGAAKKFKDQKDKENNMADNQPQDETANSSEKLNLFQGGHHIRFLRLSELPKDPEAREWFEDPDLIPIPEDHPEMVAGTPESYGCRQMSQMHLHTGLGRDILMPYSDDGLSDHLLNIYQVGVWLGIPPDGVYHQARTDRDFPQPRRFMGRTVWRESEISRYVDGLSKVWSELEGFRGMLAEVLLSPKFRAQSLMLLTQKGFLKSQGVVKWLRLLRETDTALPNSVGERVFLDPDFAEARAVEDSLLGIKPAVPRDDDSDIPF